jgi:hypothetical protein
MPKKRGDTMSININFQLAESLKFMEKRLIKVPRRKLVIFGVSLMLSSLVCHLWLFQAPFVYVTFIIGFSYFAYNSIVMIIRKIKSLFRK